MAGGLSLVTDACFEKGSYRLKLRILRRFLGESQLNCD